MDFSIDRNEKIGYNGFEEYTPSIIFQKGRSFCMEKTCQNRNEIIFKVVISIVLVIALLFLAAVGKLIYEIYLSAKYDSSLLTMADLLIEDFEYYPHDDLRIKEFDDHGRYLFSVDSGSILEVAYIIVQKDPGDGFLYYYEDSCILFLDHIETRLTKEEKAKLEQFMEQNDWDKPLQEDKMTRIAIDR